MIHTVKGFGIVNKAEVDVFLELSCFFCAWCREMEKINSIYQILTLFQLFPITQTIEPHCKWRIKLNHPHLKPEEKKRELK